MVRKKTVKEKSQAQERRTAKQLNGLPQIASGAIWAMKADVRTDEFLIENKYTDTNFYTLNVATWEKIFKEATNDNLRIPLMQIDIKDKYCIVCEESYLNMLIEDYDYTKVSTESASKSFRIKYELAELVNKKLKVGNILSTIPIVGLTFKKPKKDIKLCIIGLEHFLDLVNEYQLVY